MRPFDYQSQLKSLSKVKDKPLPSTKVDRSNVFSRNYSSNFKIPNANTSLAIHPNEHKRVSSGVFHQSHAILIDLFKHTQCSSAIHKALPSRNRDSHLLIMKRSKNAFIQGNKSHHMHSALHKPLTLTHDPPSSLCFNSKDNPLRTIHLLHGLRENSPPFYKSVTLIPRQRPSNKAALAVEGNVILAQEKDLKLKDIDEKIESFDEIIAQPSPQNNLNESLIKHNITDDCNDDNGNILESMTPRSFRELKELNDNLKAKEKPRNSLLINSNASNENVKIASVNKQDHLSSTFKIYPSNIIKYNFDSKFKLVIQSLKKKSSEE